MLLVWGWRVTEPWGTSGLFRLGSTRVTWGGGGGGGGGGKKEEEEGDQTKHKMGQMIHFCGCSLTTHYVLRNTHAKLHVQ